MGRLKGAPENALEGFKFGVRGNQLRWILCDNDTEEDTCSIHGIDRSTPIPLPDFGKLLAFSTLASDDQNMYVAATSWEGTGAILRVGEDLESSDTLWRGPLAHEILRIRFVDATDSLIVNDGVRYVHVMSDGELLQERMLEHNSDVCSSAGALYGNSGAIHLGSTKHVFRLGEHEENDTQLPGSGGSYRISCLEDRVVSIRKTSRGNSLDIYADDERIASHRLPRNDGWSWRTSRQGDYIVIWNPDKTFMYLYSGSDVRGCRLRDGFTPGALVPGGLDEAYFWRLNDAKEKVFMSIRLQESFEASPTLE